MCWLWIRLHRHRASGASMIARAEKATARLLQDASGAYVLIARAVQSDSGAEEKRERQYVADLYRLRMDPGTRGGLLYIGTGTPASTGALAHDFGVRKLRDVLARR